MRARYGAIEPDVVSTFYSLTWPKREKVFALYGEKHGESAERYARKTYREWQSGETSPSAQTLARLLEIVPAVLDFETRLGLYRKLLRVYYRRPQTIRVTIGTESDIRFVQEAADRLVQLAAAQDIPIHVRDGLSWLAQGDGQFARQLVKASDLREGEVSAAKLAEETQQIITLMSESRLVEHATHEVVLPCGTIHVTFSLKKSRGKAVSDSSKPAEGRHDQLAKREPPAPLASARDIIDDALQQPLNAEQAQALVLSAQQEALRLAAKQREGQMDSQTASREIQEFIHQAEEASSLRGMNYEAEADFRRASGKTHIKVKKQRKWWPFG